MPISAIGEAGWFALARQAPQSRAVTSDGFGRRRASRCAGFTLIELMIAIVILGLAASAVVLSLPTGPNARAEAEGLAARLAAARTLAITSNHETAMLLTGSGYSFEQRDAAGWQAARPGRRQAALAAHSFPQGLPVAAEIEGAGRLRFDPTGLATPATITLGPHRITVSAAGEIMVQ